MTVYIAKHYWKDGKNATWERHKDIDKDVFNYIKTNYDSFVQKRPKLISYKKHTIYFCYKDSKDNYGRPTTSITFFIVKKEVKYNFCDISDIKHLKIDINSNNNTLLFSIIAICILALGYVAFTLIKSKNHSNIIIENKQDYSMFIKNWNRQVKIYSDDKTLLLPKNNNSKFISKLNTIMHNISSDEKNETKWDEYTQGDIRRYKQFRQHNDQAFKNVVFDLNMSGIQIKDQLKVKTKEKTMSGIVRNILLLSDIDLWLKNQNKE